MNEMLEQTLMILFCSWFVNFSSPSSWVSFWMTSSWLEIFWAWSWKKGDFFSNNWTSCFESFKNVLSLMPTYQQSSFLHSKLLCLLCVDLFLFCNLLGLICHLWCLLKDDVFQPIHVSHKSADNSNDNPVHFCCETKLCKIITLLPSQKLEVVKIDQTGGKKNFVSPPPPMLVTPQRWSSHKSPPGEMLHPMIHLLLWLVTLMTLSPPWKCHPEFVTPSDLSLQTYHPQLSPPK